MNFTVLVALLVVLLFTTVHASHRNFGIASSPNVRLLEELETELETEDAERPVSRPRRVPQKVFCGRKLVKYVLSVCGGACTASTGLDIATTCCATMCDEDYIRKACCP